MLPLHHTSIQALADLNRQLLKSKSNVLPLELNAYKVPDRTRTCYLLVNSQTLYLMSYRYIYFAARADSEN